LSQVIQSVQSPCICKNNILKMDLLLHKKVGQKEALFLYFSFKAPFALLYWMS
jgi:hypothetical protein